VTLWKFVKSGALKASRTPGGHYRILKEDLQTFMLEREMYPIANNQSFSRKILIVDDDIHTQKLLTEALSNHKYETEVASDGFSAGIKIKEFKPSLIILDLIMPGMNGFEVCRQIKEKSSTSHIKILAITGYDTKENRDRIMEAGADDYLSKPLEISKLIQHLEVLLKQKETILRRN
jgi:DNA-binding response OmpR family regulator